MKQLFCLGNADDDAINFSSIEDRLEWEDEQKVKI